jgi:hypothetical protein
MALVVFGGPAGSLKAVTLEERAAELVELLVEGHFQAVTERFDQRMQQVLPAPKLQATWNQFIGRVGPYKGQVARRSEHLPDHTGIFITCEFATTHFDIKVVYDRGLRVVGLFFFPATTSQTYQVPPYADIAAFREEDVRVGQGKWALPGTLTLPVAGEGLPAVVLVHGSGPHGRDGTIGPNRPLRDLASGLASQGIAVLRYDKRTAVHAEVIAQISEGITVQEETVEDALLAVEAVRRAERVDRQRVFIVGHSLGAMLAPRIGRHDQQIAGFVVMAGAARPMEDLVLEQMRYVFELDGKLDHAERSRLEKMQIQVEQVKKLRPGQHVPKNQLPLLLPANYWLDLAGYDAPRLARSLQRPILVLQGGRDYQVTREDFKLWQEALEGASFAQLKLYPALNHLFFTGTGKSWPEEYMKPGYVAAQVVDDIAAWIKQK